MTLITPIGDGVADDSDAVQSYAECGERLPPGTFRITRDVARTATSPRSPGLMLCGSGMLQTKIVGDYDGDASRGGMIRFDLDAQSKYSFGNEIADLMLTPAPGRTSLNGISLTAAWMTTLKRVMISGCRIGIDTPFRPDINAISDYYQNFALDVEQCWIEGSAGAGINFGAGQSPGLFRVAFCTIISNGGIGLRTTTGQCEITENVISYNGVGGLCFDTAEGPSMVGEVTRNEIQDNRYWGVNLVRSRNLRLIGNRFLSQTYSADSMSASPQNGGPVMRQQTHVNLGAGAGGEVYNLLAEGNLHRSVNGPAATTAAVYAYNASGGSLSAAFPCRFIKNDFGPMGSNGLPDGITQNSTGLRKYVGSMPGATIVDP